MYVRALKGNMLFYPTTDLFKWFIQSVTKYLLN